MSKFDGQQDRYIEGVRRNVPGLDGLHRMTGLLLAEHVPENGRVLIVGAGGGLELKALAGQHPDWSFDGVDPSSDMLALASEVATSSTSRIHLHHGDIRAAPDGPYNGAVCLLIFHHISPDERRIALRGIHKRLRPGSPLALAHVSFRQTEPDRSLWIERHINYGATMKLDADKQDEARIGMKDRLCILSPEEEEACLQEAGFSGVTQYYHAFSFRGWVAYA